MEGGEQFDWFYNDSNNDGQGFDPNGTGLIVSLPEGDRLTQSRNAYFAGQELLGRKQYRWWWENTHQAVYDTGSGFVPQGPTTQWVAKSKSIIFAEYGFATVDKCTNQPNVFFSAGSVQSQTPFWSIWDSADGGTNIPRRDDLLAEIALQTIYDYWAPGAGSHNQSASGVDMILLDFCCAWNWDARPFPTFPADPSIWGDAANWPAGNWIGGKGPYLPAPLPPAPPSPGSFLTFPTLLGEGWSVHYEPRFSTKTAAHVSGRETRRGQTAMPLWDIELSFDVLRGGPAYSEFEALAAFFSALAGQTDPFLFAPPNGLGVFAGAALGTGDGETTVFAVSRPIGGFRERVQAFLAAPVVRANGTIVSASDYVVSILPAAIGFLTAPATGVALTIDFSAAHLARLVDADIDFEEFMVAFWEVGKLRIETVRS
jgi:hypothetical protein